MANGHTPLLSTPHADEQRPRARRLYRRLRLVDALGPRRLGVPVVVPLAWTWMAWPAWLATSTVRRWRIPLAALGLAGWDLFLDPQMVGEGYWRWRHPNPHLPGVPGVPLTDYAGWFAVALLIAALLSRLPGGGDRRRDAPMVALYLWTYLS